MWRALVKYFGSYYKTIVESAFVIRGKMFLLLSVYSISYIFSPDKVLFSQEFIFDVRFSKTIKTREFFIVKELANRNLNRAI